MKKIEIEIIYRLFVYNKYTMANTNTFFVTNDDLKSYIHNIHNYLRNNGVGYGMTALNIFSLFYGLKLIQPKLKTLGLTKEEEELLDFNVLVKKSLDIKNTNEISEYIDFKVLEKLYDMKSLNISNGNKPNPNIDLAEFLFHQIPHDVYDGVWKELIMKIDKLPIGYDATKKVNLSGKVYEYFIGRDKTAISELGAFFTDRHIVEFIYGKIKPTLNEDGNIKTMIDPFGGSGGFTLGYAYHLHNQYPNIKWEDNVNNIFHFDMQKDVVNMTGIEMFAITGAMPKKNGNYERTNSFKYDFLNRKFTYIISNPPYGGDDFPKSIEEQKKECLIEHLKNDLKNMKNTDGIYKVRKDQIQKLTSEINEYKKIQENQMVNLSTCSPRIKAFATKHNIKVANDKEACSLILLVDLLEKDGTAVLVIKEGMFFDSKYANIREVITKNFNITNIISVPSDAFENTKTKTSIIILHNNGPTTNIVFSKLIVETEPEHIFTQLEDGYVSLDKWKGDISNVYEKIICSASFDNIAGGVNVKSNGKNAKDNIKYYWSWNFKNYNNYKHFMFKDCDNINIPNDYILQKFNDVFEFKNKSKRPASFGSASGKYRFYTSSDKIKYSDVCDIDDNDNDNLIFGTGGVGTLFLDSQFSCSADNIVCYSNTELMNIYFYCYIKKFWDEFIAYHFNGSTLGHLKKQNLVNMQIPIPKNMDSIKEQLLHIKKSYIQSVQTGGNSQEDKVLFNNNLEKLFSPFTTPSPQPLPPTPLASICSITIGQSNKDTNKKKTKLYNIPHYEHYGTVYAKTAPFSGKYILGSRTGENKGEFIPVDGDFGASGNMIVINMLEGYEQHYDKVLEKLQTDFDFKKMIEDDPVIIKGSKTEFIGLKHIKSLSICL